MMWNCCPTLESVLRILSFFETSGGGGMERRCLLVNETTWQQNDSSVNDCCLGTASQRPPRITQGLIEGPGKDVCTVCSLLPRSRWEVPFLRHTFEQTLTGAAWYCSSPRTSSALWCCSARGTCSNTFGNEIHSEETSDIYHRRLASDMFSEPERRTTRHER